MAPEPPRPAPVAAEGAESSTERLAAIRARLEAFAHGPNFPEADLIEATGERERGWDGPYLAGTYLPVGIVGRNLADDWEDWRSCYPLQTDDALRAAREYYLAHTDQFQAQRWRDVDFDKRYLPVGDGKRLQSDVASLLDHLAALAARADAAEAVVDAAGNLADWLPGVWADYTGICREDPCCIIPTDLEQMIHAIEAKGFALRDVVERYYTFLAGLVAAPEEGAGRGEG